MSEQDVIDVNTDASIPSLLNKQDGNDYKTSFYQFSIDNKFNDKFFGPCAHNINVRPGDRLCLIPYSCIWPDEIGHNDSLTKDWSNDQIIDCLLSNDDHKYDVALDSNNHTSLLDLMCTYRFYSKRIFIDNKISIYDFYLKGSSRFNGMVVKINNFWFLNFESTNKQKSN